MNSVIEQPTPNPPRKHLPRWWTESVETSWNRVKAEALDEWDQLEAYEKKLEREIAEEAIAFGHGGCETYDKLYEWGGDLEDKLKADWADSHEAALAWESVRDAVKHGWQRARKAVKPTPEIEKTSDD